MTAISDAARDLAMNTTGDRIGVVLATLPGHHGAPSWSAYPMRTPEALHAWFGDWAGTPDLYVYLATYDKTSPAWLENGGAPLLELSNEHAPVDAVTQSSGVKTSELQSTVSPFSILSNLVAQHEIYWAGLAQANPHHAQLRAFLAYAWDPFYAAWISLVTEHGLSDDDQDVLSDEAAKLQAVRDYAQRHGISAPNLKGLDDMTKVSGGHGGYGGFHGGGHGGGGGGGFHGGGHGYGQPHGHGHAPGFHGRGGYYRHGSAYPGRWWSGGDGRPVWIESDANLLVDDQASPYDDLAPPSTDDQPIDDDAAGDAPPDRAPDAPAGSAADSAPAAVQGWRELIAPFLVSGRANAAAAPKGSRALDVAPVLAPGVRPMKLAFAIEGNDLVATVTADGRTYQATADLAPIWATLEPRLAAWHAEMHARGHALVGFSSQYPVADRRVAGGSGAELVTSIGSQGSPRSTLIHALDGYRGGGIAHALVGAGISVSGGCGTRTYGNVTPTVIAAILNGLKDRGADVTGSNPWYAVTHDHGVEFRGTWNQAQQSLAIEVTDSDFYVPCSKVWDAIEPMLAGQGAVPTASLERELGETNEQIRALSQALVGGLADAHAGALCGAWLDGVAHALGCARREIVRGNANADAPIAGGPAHTLIKLRDPIATAAGIAASATALALPSMNECPTLAPMAGSLACSIVHATASPPSEGADAHAAVTSAIEEAPSDPVIARALEIARKAAAQATAAYHVMQVAANAAAGSSDARAQLAELVRAADGGDSAAAQALRVATSASKAAADNATGNADVFVGGWLDSIGNAFKDVGVAVYHGEEAVRHVSNKITMKLKPLITVAATAVATAYGGPAAGAAAAKFTGPIIDATASDTGEAPQKKAAAQQQVAQIQQAAAVNPIVAQAYNAANKAVAQTTSAYHVTQVAADAAKGDPTAKSQLAQLTQSAASGNPQSQSVLDAAFTAVTSAAGKYATDYYNKSKLDANGIDESLIEIDPPAGATDASATASSGWFVPLLAGLGVGAGAGYFGPDVYHWAKAKWDAHKANSRPIYGPPTPATV